MVAKELVVITGMSGAGRSTVAHSLEDLGWYVVDNLPPSLLSNLYELSERSTSSIAVVIDVRGREFFDDLNISLAELAEKGISRKVVFVDAADDVLVRRFESTRRPHPLQGNDRILDGIHKERERLRDVRSVSDLVIDSSSLNIHQLDKKVLEIFSVGNDADLKVNILSFGYKYGIPVDSDLVLDCRFIPNPHWVPELRELTGLTPQVANYVFDKPEVLDVVNRYVQLMKTLSKGYLREGKKYVTLAIGCTGGKHRSVAIAERIAKELDAEAEISAKAIHRDLGRE